MGWVNERVGLNKSFTTWTPVFLAFKGQDVCMFEQPPVSDLPIAISATRVSYVPLILVPHTTLFLLGV